MRRLLIGLVAALTLSSVVSGCSPLVPHLACPAIGWINTVTVILEGPVQNVSVVEFCAEGVCSTPSPGETQPDEPLRPATANPQDATSYPTTAPTATVFPYGATKVDDRSWKFSLDMTSPKDATVRALTADGEVLAERDVTLTWTRVGGSERCGGPSEAAPILLSIPS